MHKAHLEICKTIQGCQSNHETTTKVKEKQGVLGVGKAYTDE
jgi:hypothetical protein